MLFFCGEDFYANQPAFQGPRSSCGRLEPEPISTPSVPSVCATQTSATKGHGFFSRATLEQPRKVEGKSCPGPREEVGLLTLELQPVLGFRGQVNSASFSETVRTLSNPPLPPWGATSALLLLLLLTRCLQRDAVAPCMDFNRWNLGLSGTEWLAPLGCGTRVSQHQRSNACLQP